jgi:hypothetical protein
LLVSDDHGSTWRPVPTRFGDARLIALVAADNVVFVATRSPHETVVWRSTDGGDCWQRWLVDSSPRDVAPLAVSPEYPIDELVCVGMGGRVLTPVRHTREVRSGERRPIWRGADLEAATTVLDLLVQGRTVYAATSAGVFISRDAGATFDAWSEGLGRRPVVAMSSAPKERLLFGVGLGGTIWQRHDSSAPHPR